MIDVGARRGESGIWLRRMGYTRWIHSFEPVAANFAALSLQAETDDRWVVHNVALGREASRAEINVTEGAAFSSFRTPTAFATETFGSHPEITATETVQIETLDAIFDGLLDGVQTPRVYLKLDTQGWDLEVLQGARASLARIDALQTEVSVQTIYEGMPTMRESLDYLSAIGFAVSGFFTVSLDRQLRLVEVDCVAVKTAVPPPHRPD